MMQKIYRIWFYINKYLVEAIQRHISPALGAIFGMLFLEAHTICKAAWYTLKKYRKDPKVYGLNQWDVTRCSYRPVLLLHGAVGSWSYLGDLAVGLKKANIPVFVIDFGTGLPTDEMRKKIFNRIEEIRGLYHHSNQKSDAESYARQIERQSLRSTQQKNSTIKLIKTSDDTDASRSAVDSTIPDFIPLVDIIAHSNGGNLGLYSAFTEDCSYIDGEGNLKFRSTPQANPHIGKVITIALPTNKMETNWIHDINKLDDLYNINATFDALMGHKKCALVEEHPSHVQYIDAGHIGIVFNPTTYNRLLQFLFK
jgi:hypothetical protein